jgi:predicted HAD superfamily phosphohydrolase YqeG
LDIDGTLGHDGVIAMTQTTMDMVASLAQYNKVYLLSNKPLPERNAAFSKLLSIPYLQSPYKKPHSKIAEALLEEEKGNVVVIGDKYITDGLFAKRINAEFIKVKRIGRRNEGIKTVLSYIIDDIIYGVVSFF